MRSGCAHILDLLRSLGPVAQRIERLGREEGLLGEVRALLPVGERPHCVRAALRGGTLTLTLDSALWATRLRYRIPELLAAFAPAGVTALKTRIEPPGQGPLGPARRPWSAAPQGIRLSPGVANHLRAAAHEISDPGIAEALRRLARRGGP